MSNRQPQWRTPHVRFEGNLASMSDASLARLNQLAKQGRPFDVYTVAAKMADQDRAAREAALPPIPADLLPHWDGPKNYAGMATIADHDTQALIAHRRRMIADARRRQQLAAEQAPTNPRFSDRDLSAIFADAMPSLPDSEPTRTRRTKR